MASPKNAGKRVQPFECTGEFELPSPGEVVAPHEDLPAKPPEDKKIHRRRPLPLVPEAPAENPDENRKRDQPAREES
jgi:hypothetical protein